MAMSELKQGALTTLNAIGDVALKSYAGDLGMAYRHGSRLRRAVALTFDDGPVLGGTEETLDALGEHNAPGTFFCIGVNALMHPQIIERAVAEGHVIGAHSMRHSRIDTVSPSDSGQIDACAQALRAALGGRAPALYRPPWGWLTPWEALRLRQRHMAIIRWDIETDDWQVPCPPGEAMARRTAPLAQPGSIIVFHDGMTHAERHEKPETAKAVRLLIPELRARGFELVTIPELLGIPAYHEPAATDAAPVGATV